MRATPLVIPSRLPTAPSPAPAPSPTPPSGSLTPGNTTTTNPTTAPSLRNPSLSPSLFSPPMLGMHLPMLRSSLSQPLLDSYTPTFTPPINSSNSPSPSPSPNLNGSPYTNFTARMRLATRQMAPAAANDVISLSQMANNQMTMTGVGVGGRPGSPATAAATATAAAMAVQAAQAQAMAQHHAQKAQAQAQAQAQMNSNTSFRPLNPTSSSSTSSSSSSSTQRKRKSAVPAGPTTHSKRTRAPSPTSSVSSASSTPATTSRRSAFTSTALASSQVNPPSSIKGFAIPSHDDMEPSRAQSPSPKTSPRSPVDDDDHSSPTNASAHHAHIRKKKHRITDRQRRAKIKDGMEALRGLVHLNATGKPGEASGMDQATIIASSVKLVKQLNAEVATLKQQLVSQCLPTVPTTTVVMNDGCSKCKQYDEQKQISNQKTMEIPSLESITSGIKNEQGLLDILNGVTSSSSRTSTSTSTCTSRANRVISLLTYQRYAHLITSLPSHDPLRLTLIPPTFMSSPIPKWKANQHVSQQVIDSLFLHVISYLSLPDLYGIISLVSSDWLTAICSPLLWYNIHHIKFHHLPYPNQYGSIMRLLTNLHTLELDLESSLAYIQQCLQPKLSLTSPTPKFSGITTPIQPLYMSECPAKASPCTPPPDPYQSILSLLPHIIRYCPSLTTFHTHHSLYAIYFHLSIYRYQSHLIPSYMRTKIHTFETELTKSLRHMISHTQVMHIHIPHAITSMILRTMCTYAAPRLLTLAIPTAGLPLYDLTNREDVHAIAQCHSLTHLDLSMNTHLSTPQQYQLQCHHTMMLSGNIPINKMTCHISDITTQQAMNTNSAHHWTLIEAFTLLATNLSNLRVLKLDGQLIDDHAFSMFLEHCRYLQCISLHKCSLITTTAIANAKLMLPNSTILI